MKKILSFLCLCSFCFAQWIMFADSKDTYLYNTQTGEVYIRYKKKGKNYQDVFVKMPKGMSPQEVEGEAKVEKNASNAGVDPLLDSKMQSLKKSQEMMNEALKGDF